MSIKKIISGFQTGADIGGILAAKRLGLETGGTMPKGFRTEDGPRPEFAELYGAVELDLPGYTPRTIENARNSDGTIIFGDISSPGSRQTLKFCKQYSKPYFYVGTSGVLHYGLIRDGFTGWLIANKIETLNVAGNRESKCPGIQEFVSQFLYDALS